MHPILDGGEVLDQARAIAAGNYGTEPFFVPPLYPALLSFALKAGLKEAMLPDIARGLNFLCHLVSTLSVTYIARRVWRSRRCGFSAGLLWGLNPVALHFAGDPLPVNLAVCLLLLGCCGAAQMLRRRGPRLWGVLICASCWSLVFLTVPQGIVLLPLCPLLALIVVRGTRNKSIATIFSIVISIAVFGGFAYTNHKISGQLEFVPLQNAFDFWMANRPGSHGRYPQRLVAARSFDESTLTARVESERLYAEENPPLVTTDYSVINRYWRSQAWNYIRDHTNRFLNHLSDKFLYLVNNFEQYDNKTYFLHKQRSPWLAFNPISWGLLLVMAGAGVCLAWARPVTRTVIAVAIFYAIAVLAFFVSARERLPLVPILAVFSGWVGRPRFQFMLANRRSTIAAIVAAIVVGVVTFAPLPENERTETVVFDHLGMARAATALGDYLLAVRHAEAAAAYQPHSALALETLCLTRYRYWRAIAPKYPVTETAEETLAACENAARVLSSNQAAYVSAVYLWRKGNAQKALDIWYRLADSTSEQSELALQALIVTAQTRGKDEAWLERVSRSDLSDPLLLALAFRSDQAAAQELRKRLSLDQRQRQLSELGALLTDPTPR